MAKLSSTKETWRLGGEFHDIEYTRVVTVDQTGDFSVGIPTPVTKGGVPIDLVEIGKKAGIRVFSSHGGYYVQAKTLVDMRNMEFLLKKSVVTYEKKYDLVIGLAVENSANLWWNGDKHYPNGHIDPDSSNGYWGKSNAFSSHGNASIALLFGAFVKVITINTMNGDESVSYTRLSANSEIAGMDIPPEAFSMNEYVNFSLGRISEKNIVIPFSAEAAQTLMATADTLGKVSRVLEVFVVKNTEDIETHSRMIDDLLRKGSVLRLGSSL